MSAPTTQPAAADKAAPQWQWRGGELWTTHSSNGLSMDRLVLLADFVCVPAVADDYKKSILAALNQSAAVDALELVARRVLQQADYLRANCKTQAKGEISELKDEARAALAQVEQLKGKGDD